MKTLGKYEVLAELATGSMGVLYRGRDTMLDREVALKTIAGTGSLDPELKERFYREARSGARLHHPNVITVYELGEQDGLVFIALELLTGCDLRQFIAQRRPLPIPKKMEIMAAVCDGLHHAHLNGIVHRDIKPSNIFLTDTNVPKILDFGVARLSASKLTVVGRVLGTPFYMAPEQIMGQPCDARSDLFSLAIVLFEFLTYAHPFAGDSIPKRIINDNPDSLLSHNPDLPPDLDSILFRALAKDPSQRYQNVDELGQALRAVAQESAGFGTQTQTQTQPQPLAQPPVTREQAPPVAEEPPQYANTEYKMSAILLALQEFDSAVDHQNVPLARAALATVEKLAKLDDRFATAAKESRTRLHELEARMPPAPEPVKPPTPVYTPQPVVEQPPVRHTAPPTPPRTPPATPPRTAPRTPAPMDAPRTTPAPPPYYETRPRPPADVPPPDVRQTPPSSVAPAPPESSVDDVTSMFRVPDLSALPSRPSTIPSSPPPRTAPPPPDRRSPAPMAPTTPERRSIPPSYVPPAPQATQPMPPARPATLPPYARPTMPTTAPLLPPRPPVPAKNTRLLLIVAAVGAILILVAVLVWLLTRNQSAARVSAEATAQVAAAQASIFESPSDDAAELVALKKGDTVAVIRPPRSRSQEWIEVQYATKNKVYPVGAMHTADLGNWTSAKPDVALSLIQTYAPGDGASDAELRAYANRLTSFMQQFSAPEQKAAAQAELNRINAALAHADGAPPAPNGSNPPNAPPAKPGATPAKPAAPFDADAAMARAEQYWENADYAQAEAQLKRILQYHPNHQAAKKLLERVQKAKQLESAQ